MLLRASDAKKPSTTKTQLCDVLQPAKKYPVTVNVRLKIESLGGRVAQDTRDVADHDAPVDAGGLMSRTPFGPFVRHC